MKRRMHLVLAKLSLAPDLFSAKLDLTELQNKVVLALHKTNTVRIGQSRWVFDAVGTIDEDELVAYGRLVKIRDIDLQVWDKELKVLEIPNKARVANFAYAASEELLLFEERSDISIKEFCKAFAALVMNNCPELGQAFVKPILEMGSERITEMFSEIHSVSLQLVRTNPNMRPEFEKLDHYIFEQTNAQSVHINIKGRYLRAEGNVIAEGLHKAAAGYGDFRLTGVDAEGNMRKITSKDKAVRFEEECEDDPLDFAKECKAKGLFRRRREL